jgi:hypothetical protein
MVTINRWSFSVRYPKGNSASVRAAETTLFCRAPNLITIWEAILPPSISKVAQNSPNPDRFSCALTPRVVTIIDLLPITVIDGSRGLHTAEVPVTSFLYSGLPFRSLFSLGGGTGNAPLISLRPSLITEHHFEST